MVELVDGDVVEEGIEVRTEPPVRIPPIAYWVEVTITVFIVRAVKNTVIVCVLKQRHCQQWP